jgi:hypothetical protein
MVAPPDRDHAAAGRVRSIGDLGYASVIAAWPPPTVEPHPLCAPPVSASPATVAPSRERAATASSIAKFVTVGLTVSSMALLVTTLVRAGEREQDRRARVEAAQAAATAVPGLRIGGDATSAALDDTDEQVTPTTTTAPPTTAPCTGSRCR